MKRLLLATLVALAACKPDLGAPASLITEPRVLAIRSEPAEVAPGKDTQLTALVASPDAAPHTHRYLLWEKGSPSPFDGSPQTFLCEWTASGHITHDDGPPYTGQLEVDAPAFIARCRVLLGQEPVATA